MDSLCEFLFDCDFSKCFQSSNIEYVWKFIKGSICHAMDLFIPKVKLRSSKHPRWFNSDIRHHLNCLHSLRRKVKVHPSKLNLMKIKSSEKLLQEKMLSAKKLYESQLTQKLYKHEYVIQIYQQCNTSRFNPFHHCIRLFYCFI